MVAHLNTQGLEGFILRDISVSCPECQCSFSTTSLLELPPVTEFDTIEADLHRVLPDAELRGALIAVCPHCNYASWTVRFKGSSFSPEMLPDAEKIDHSKKFALAVKHAREKNVNPLDIAFIALNGLYCARESGESGELWLELAAYEQSRGIEEETLVPATGQDFLVMAELWRQLGSFDRALEFYEKSAEDEFIPRELIQHQISQTRAENMMPTALPPYVVREIFPDASELAASVQVGKNGRPVPPNIVRRPRTNKLAMVDFGPPDRKAVLSSAVQDFRNADLTADETEIVALGPVIPATNAPEILVVTPDPAEVTVPVVAEVPVLAVAPAVAEVPVLAVAPAIAEVPVVAEVPAPQELPSAPMAVAPPVSEKQSLPAGTVAAAKSESGSVSVERISEIIAVPQGASAIYLVQAAQVPQADPASKSSNSSGAHVANISVQSQPFGQAQPASSSEQSRSGAGDADNTVSGGKPKKKAAKPKAPQPNPLPPMEAPTPEDFASAPSQGSRAGSSQPSAARSRHEVPDVHIPGIDLTDEYVDEDEAPAYDYGDDDSALAGQSADPAKSDFTDAIAQVESFLSLTRQSSYQSWVRSHRR